MTYIFWSLDFSNYWLLINYSIYKSSYLAVLFRNASASFRSFSDWYFLLLPMVVKFLLKIIINDLTVLYIHMIKSNFCKLYTYKYNNYNSNLMRILTANFWSIRINVQLLFLIILVMIRSFCVIDKFNGLK